MDKVHVTAIRARLNDDDRTQLLIDIEGEVYGDHAGVSGGTITVPSTSTAVEILTAAKTAIVAKCQRSGIEITEADIIVWGGPQ